MDWSIVQQYLPFYQKAFFLTLHIAVLGILGSFLLGLVVSVIRHYRVPILSQLSTAYISLLWLASYRFGSILRGLCCGRFDFLGWFLYGGVLPKWPRGC